MTSDPFSHIDPELARKAKAAGLRNAREGGGTFISSSDCPVEECSRADLHTHHICSTCGALDEANQQCGRCKVRETILEFGAALAGLRVSMVRVKTTILFIVALSLATIANLRM